MKTDSTLDQKSTPAGEVDSGGCAPMPGSVVRWHAVADQMPDDDLTVMIHHAEGDEPVWLGYYDGDDGTWRTVDGARTVVTHWAEMPDPPNVLAHTPGANEKPLK